MKEQMQALWDKVVENKEVVIRGTAVIVGAALGAVVATVVINNQNDDLLLEEVEMEEITDLEGE